MFSFNVTSHQRCWWRVSFISGIFIKIDIERFIQLFIYKDIVNWFVLIAHKIMFNSHKFDNYWFLSWFSKKNNISQEFIGDIFAFLKAVILTSTGYYIRDNIYWVIHFLVGRKRYWRWRGKEAKWWCMSKLWKEDRAIISNLLKALFI